MAENTAPALLRFGVPLGIFLALVVLLAIGLNLNPREVPSPLIDKPAPGFFLPQLHAPERNFSPASMKGQVWILNVWASWCEACRDEHPVLVDFAKRGVAPLLGLNYKDRRADALEWLKRFGDPYSTSIVDAEGKVATRQELLVAAHVEREIAEPYIGWLISKGLAGFGDEEGTVRLLDAGRTMMDAYLDRRGMRGHDKKFMH